MAFGSLVTLAHFISASYRVPLQQQSVRCSKEQLNINWPAACIAKPVD